MAGIKGIHAGKNSPCYIHGCTNTRLFKIWSSMKERCYRAAHPHYKDYGGRGIAVCEEWKSDLLVFKNRAMVNGYADNLTIDRKDVNGDYSPDNCRWVTMKEQQNNKRSNHRVSLNGVSHTITEWAEITAIKKTTIKERLRCGWAEEKALTMPVRKRADMRGENNGCQGKVGGVAWRQTYLWERHLM